ncbi:MAG: hypothetical protein K9H64_12045 [Bacteroidales bacterium]|nr:hypothetical protein [Bacteroidales bacterium]MCF8456823.1 hypothetical protein [Bacteroidales bacterium]
MKILRLLPLFLLSGILGFQSCSKDDESEKVPVSLKVIEGESMEYTIDGATSQISLGDHWDDIRNKLGEPDLTTTYSATYWGTVLNFNESRNLTSGTIFPFIVSSDKYVVESAITEMGISMGDDRSKVYQVYGTNFITVAGGEERFPDYGVRFGYDDYDKVEYIWLVSMN